MVSILQNKKAVSKVHHLGAPFCFLGVYIRLANGSTVINSNKSLLAICPKTTYAGRLLYGNGRIKVFIGKYVYKDIPETRILVLCFG